MCDYNEYSIVRPEHCLFVPCLTEEQIKLFNQNSYSHKTFLVFRTSQTSWELTITYYANYKYIQFICIKNIHGMVNQSELINEPLAEIVLWYWKDNKQESIQKGLFERNAIKSLPLMQHCITDVHFIIRPIKKRKLAEDVCRPLDFLSSGSDAFTISVGDQNFVVSAHRLMQISPVFLAMLTDEMREKAERKVEVKEAEPEHFRAFLEVIDPDQNVQPNPINVVGVLMLADRYQVNLAKDRCESHLMNCVEMPVIERIQLADIYGLNELKASILSLGRAILDDLYKANLDMFKKGQFSNAMLQEITLRIYNNYNNL